MKKAIVVGGSNGIGLAIANKLMQKNYHVLIIDKEEPESSLIFKEDLYTYFFAICQTLTLIFLMN